MGASPAGYVSVHGKRLGLLGNGMLSVDGKAFKGAIPTLGKDIFVDSVTGADTSDGLTPDRALATLDAAFALCTADKGYQVFCLPKHAETVTGAAGIAHDVAGVSVFGLGHGGQRPKILLDGGTAVTYKITANDALVSNIVLNAGHSDIVTAVDVQVATDAWLDQIDFQNNASNENYLTCIKSGTTTDNQCDGLKVTSCRWAQPDAGSLEFIEILGDLDWLHVTDNFVSHEGTGLAPLIVVTDGDDIQDAFISRNTIRFKDTADGVGILQADQTDCTGILSHNFVGMLDIAGEVMHTASNTGLYAFENYSSSVVTVSGYLLPVKDS